MTEKTQKKPVIAYEIQTTPEVEETVYFAMRIQIIGQYVKFKPFLYRTRSETYPNKQGTVVILPERVIKRIFKQEITQEMRKEFG